MKDNTDVEIKKILARVFKNDVEERQMLEKVFGELLKHQENFFNDLENRISAERDAHNWDKDFDVAIKFVPSGDTESAQGLYKLDVESNFILADDEEKIVNSKKNFFINAAYNEIQNFCEPKKYKGRLVTSDGTEKIFSYTFQRHERFINDEKILFETAALYKIRRPVIFSPYARKSVDLKIFELDEDDFKNYRSLDLMLEKNNLNGKILCGNLFWNVKIEQNEMNCGNEVEEYLGADGNLIRYETFHTFNADQKIFVLPFQHCDDLKISVNATEKNFTLGYSSVLKERDCYTIEIFEIEKITDDFFTNDFPKENDKLRLKTEGDVEKVLSCFNATRAGKKFPATFESFNAKNFKPIEIYRREDKYFVSPEMNLLGKIRNKPICCIKFGGNNSVFKIDYVNYVLHYFELNYPEFNWAGVES